LAEVFRQRGTVVHVTREPGGTALGEKLRQLLLDPVNRCTGGRGDADVRRAARTSRRVIEPALARVTGWCATALLTHRLLTRAAGAAWHGRAGATREWTQRGLQPIYLLFDLA